MDNERLEDLYARVDARAGELHSKHESRLKCRRGCASCCVDGLQVFELEAQRIRGRHRRLLEQGTPSEHGCAFLGPDQGCRIYPDRPYVCRTQGLPLRWLESEGEYRDICPLNASDREGRPGLPILDVPAEDCFEIGPFEGELAQIQADQQREAGKLGGPLVRIALRDLFRSGIRGRV